MQARVRFAPSPTGLPHIGNIRTALFNWLWARNTGGQFILRIEDTDRERYDPKALNAIMEGLRWIGLDYDEGPDKPGDYGPYFQSERLSIYHHYAEQLVESGHAYWCNCSKERLDNLRAYQTENKLPPGYDRHCRDLNLKSSPTDPNTVLRFRIPENETVIFNDFLRGEISFQSKDLDDLVLLKSDGFPTYHFAVVIDDYLMKITHILRAEEWIPSAGKHVLIYKALGFTPPEFVHLPMILGNDRSKLSKRHGATSILEYKDMGFLPEAVFNFIALLGWSPGNNKEIISKEEMISLFDISNINKSSAVFDIEKLKWMNSEFIRLLSPEELTQKLLPIYETKNWVRDEAYLNRVSKAIQERIKLLPDIVDLGAFFFEEITTYDEKGIQKHFNHENSVENIDLIIESFSKISDWTEHNLEEAIRMISEEKGMKAATFIHLMRLSVSGMTFGPSAFELTEIIGKEKVIQRLQNAKDYIINNLR